MTAGLHTRAGHGGDESRQLVRFTLPGQVAEIELAAGPLNLVTIPLLRQLDTVLSDIGRNEAIRCVIVHGGAARAFCAGSDIGELAELGQNASERKILFEDMVLRNLARLAVPTIAAIDGPALGGGLELALACDLRVARAGVMLGLTESRLGGLGANGAVRMARLIGPSRTKDLLFTGEAITAERAFEWGVVNRVVEDGSALNCARSLAATIADRGPISNRLGKMLADAAMDETLDGALCKSTVAQQQIFDSEDLGEGVAAFFAKRMPRFHNR